MALTGIGYGLAVTPGHILVLMLVNGLAELGVWLALQALVTHAGAGAFLSRQLWLFSLGWGIGVAVGPVVGGIVLEYVGFPALGFLFAALSLAATVVVFVPYPRRHDDMSSGGGEPRPSEESALLTIARRPAVKGVLLSSYVVLFVNAIRLSFYPLYLKWEGISLSRIGVLLSSFGVASLLIRFLLQRVVRRWGAGRVLVWSIAVPGPDGGDALAVRSLLAAPGRRRAHRCRIWDEPARDRGVDGTAHQTLGTRGGHGNADHFQSARAGHSATPVRRRGVERQCGRCLPDGRRAPGGIDHLDMARGRSDFLGE